MNETSSLKSLAYNALERLEKNKQQKTGTTTSKAVSAPVFYRTESINTVEPALLQLSSLPEMYEERIAIAEHDGQQTPTQAQRIAYQDAFIAVLNTLPYEDHYENNWLDQRIKATKEWLHAQGLQQPE